MPKTSFRRGKYSPERKTNRRHAPFGFRAASLIAAFVFLGHCLGGLVLFRPLIKLGLVLGISARPECDQ